MRTSATVTLTTWEYRSSTPLTRDVPWGFALQVSESPMWRVRVTTSWDEVLIDTK